MGLVASGPQPDALHLLGAALSATICALRLSLCADRAAPQALVGALHDTFVVFAPIAGVGVVALLLRRRG